MIKIKEEFLDSSFLLLTNQQNYGIIYFHNLQAEKIKYTFSKILLTFQKTYDIIKSENNKTFKGEE